MKVWKWLKPILILLLCTGFIISGVNILIYIKDGNQNKQLNQSIKQMVYNKHSFENNEPVDSTSEGNSLDDEELVEYTQYEEVYNNLVQVNKDSIGWLSISDTSIDYPVLQADDNDYYLDHNIKSEQSVRGSIFMDWQSRKNDSHIILYGHNMKDGSMFGNLKLFEEVDYYNAHTIIELNIYGKLTRWEIFSVAFSDDTPFRVQFADTTDFEEYVNKMKQDSIYDTGVAITQSDRVLTLSTCSNEFLNARLVLHAKEIE